MEDRHETDSAAERRELLAIFSSGERESLTQEWLDLQAELFDYSRPAAERRHIEERLADIAARRDAVIARASKAERRLAELDRPPQYVPNRIKATFDLRDAAGELMGTLTCEEETEAEITEGVEHLLALHKSQGLELTAVRLP